MNSGNFSFVLIFPMLQQQKVAAGKIRQVTTSSKQFGENLVGLTNFSIELRRKLSTWIWRKSLDNLRRKGIQTLRILALSSKISMLIRLVDWT